MEEYVPEWSGVPGTAMRLCGVGHAAVLYLMVMYRPLSEGNVSSSISFLFPQDLKADSWPLKLVKSEAVLPLHPASPLDFTQALVSVIYVSSLLFTTCLLQFFHK